jgi:hypothetical protein
MRLELALREAAFGRAGVVNAAKALKEGLLPFSVDPDEPEYDENRKTPRTVCFMVRGDTAQLGAVIVPARAEVFCRRGHEFDIWRLMLSHGTPGEPQVSPLGEAHLARARSALGLLCDGRMVLADIKQRDYPVWELPGVDHVRPAVCPDDYEMMWLAPRPRGQLDPPDTLLSMRWVCVSRGRTADHP